ALITYAGGNTEIEGSFANFAPIEAHQATLRLTNSTLEENADGADSTTRHGRMDNVASTVFVRGAQPVIVDNVIQDNEGPAIHINANSLDAVNRPDSGRATGSVALFNQFNDNYGPLIRLNRLKDTATNGLEIRAEQLTTESIWDNTDIAHVVRDEILVANHHTYNGLRLQSSSTESLVIKLLGGNAGFTATGEVGDINDRIGGTVQVLGEPGFPVVMTSVYDCSVPAGLTTDGLPQFETIQGSCSVGAGAQFADIIVVIDESGTMSLTQQFTETFIPQLEAALVSIGVGDGTVGTNRYGLVGFGGSSFTNELTGHAHPLGPTGALWGTAAEYVIAAQGLSTSGGTEDGYSGIDFALDNYAYRSSAAKFIILATDEDRDIVDATLDFPGISSALRSAGVKLHGILSTNLVDGAGTMAVAVDGVGTAFLPDGFGGFTLSTGGQVQSIQPLGQPGTQADYVDLVWSVDPTSLVGDIAAIGNTATLDAQSFANALITTIGAQIASQATSGDWRDITLEQYSNDRNVAVLNESESSYIRGNDVNDTSLSAESLGILAPNEKSGDETRRLGFEVLGHIAYDDPTDTDIYTFDAVAGTEVWLDLDRTGSTLDARLAL
ncbi:MAG: VWA domain-containing protein, partial [Planctomycetales bacterium]|nr:VWA domain-containing protein [Planctomycetales bacterium]